METSPEASMLTKRLLRTINSSQMRSVNRSAILELIRQRGPIARSEIARLLGLSQPTVMRIVDDLLVKEMVRYNGEREASRGRYRNLVEYYKDGHYVIGVDLGGSKMFGALANIGGEIQSEMAIDGHGTSNEASFELLVNMIQQLMDANIDKKQRLSGIAVGAPGVTDPETGVVKWAPSLNWRDFPLKERLEKQFNIPCLVENDVNLAALGEHWFGAGQGCQNLVLIAIGTGLGAGLILEGALFRGHLHSAGEVGYLVSSRDELDQEYDQFGALENRISGTGIAKRAQTILVNHPQENKYPGITSNDVFDAARRKEKWALEVVAETVDYLSIAIVNISTLLSPEVIILGGGVSRSADLLIPDVKRRTHGVIPVIPEIKASKLGRRAAVMGATVMVIQSTGEYFVVNKLS